MLFQNPLLILIIQIGPILVMFVINYCLYKMNNKEFKEYDFKIFDFDFNGFCIISYILGYLYLIFWYKISYINKTTDLKPFIIYLKEIYAVNSFILLSKKVILVILMIICFIYIIKIIHKFFRKELKKRFIIIQIIYNNINLTPYLLQTIKQKCDTLITRIFVRYDFLLSKKTSNFFWKILLFSNNIIFYKMPTIILLLFFSYVVVYNDYVLTPFFYKYLLFYFFYYNYKNISLFLDETDYGLNKILFNMYYKQKTIKYINIPQNYQNVIRRYISLSLQRNLTKHPEPLLDDILGAFYFKMSSECEFFLVETIEKGFYSNQEGDHFLEINNDVDTNIYNFYFSTKIYEYLKKTIIMKMTLLIKRKNIQLPKNNGTKDDE